MTTLTVQQAAAKRGVSRYAIYAWMRRGLKFEKRGGVAFIAPADLIAFEPLPAGNPNPANNGAARRKKRK